MSSDSRSRSRSRSRSPIDRRIRSDRHSYRDAPYRRGGGDSRRGFSRDNLCKNCKRPGHFARECPNVAICHNCGLPGHIASECTTKSLCWNCKEPGHMASSCPNEGICHTCGKVGHRARDCSMPPMPPGDLRLCNNCYKQGHIAVECTNEKACNNCRKTGHLARDCPNDPICNLCNVSGHVARQCPKANELGERSRGGSGGFRGGGGYRDVVCRNCQQLGHMSRDCMGPLMICHNCGCYDLPVLDFENLKKTNPGISFTDVGRVLGEKWKKMSAEEKEPCEAKARADKICYKDEISGYKPQATNVDSGNESDSS